MIIATRPPVQHIRMSLAERRRQGTGLESAVENLSIGTQREASLDRKSTKSSATTASSASRSTVKPSKPIVKEPSVADSWEDEASDGGSDTETEGPSIRPSMPAPPPPTPMTPGYGIGLGPGTEAPPPTPMTPATPAYGDIAAPPPTPATPSYRPVSMSAVPASVNLEFDDPYAIKEENESRFGGKRRSLNPSDARRPEKQNATASRMIAGALGMKAPKRTEEQRAYDKAIREKESKRLEKEREDKARDEQDKEKAKAAVWDD